MIIWKLFGLFFKFQTIHYRACKLRKFYSAYIISNANVYGIQASSSNVDSVCVISLNFCSFWRKRLKHLTFKLIVFPYRNRLYFEAALQERYRNGKNHQLNVIKKHDDLTENNKIWLHNLCSS